MFLMHVGAQVSEEFDVTEILVLYCIVLYGDSLRY